MLNNPLKYTDPSGYRPEAIFEEEEMRRRNGGGGANGFNYFGWVHMSAPGLEPAWVNEAIYAHSVANNINDLNNSMSGGTWSPGMSSPHYYSVRESYLRAFQDVTETVLGEDHLGNQEVLVENNITGHLSTRKDAFFKVTGNYYNQDYFLSGVIAYGDLNLLERMMLSKMSVSAMIPAAWSWEINGSAEGGLASSLSLIGGVLGLRGSDIGKYKSFLSVGGGAGGVSVSLQILQTKYFYFGDIDNFDLRVFEGGSADFDATGGEGLVAGINLTFMAGNAPGEFVIGIGKSIGVGAGSPFSGSGTYQRTWFY